MKNSHSPSTSIIQKLLGLFLASFLLAVFLIVSHPVSAEPPELKAHPLPTSLAQWQDPSNSGDYFDRITVLPFGYLLWSQFPIKVYIESTPSSTAWQAQVKQAVLEWDIYLPLEIVNHQDQADISIFRKIPPLTKGELRARSAQTTYQLYTETRNNQQILSHRCKILLSPTQIGKYVAAAARHEFGHALGIWGHSPFNTDVLYFAQVSAPPPISVRDVNTLKKIYQQTTALGWPLSSSHHSDKD